MSLYIVDIHGELEGDYEIVKKYEEPTTKNDLGVDAVSRQEVLYLVADYDLSMGQVVKGIHALPPVIPQEPKTGHWEYGYAFPDGQYCRCSECEELIKCIYPMHYCPNCGAKMAETEAEDGNDD